MTPPSKQTETFFLWAHRVLMPILTFLIAATMGLMGWVGNKVWEEARLWMRDFNIRVAKLELAEARAESNRFTSGDWAAAKSRIDEDRQNLDRRITRQEEAMLAIKETLDRIEEKIDVFNEK